MSAILSPYEDGRAVKALDLFSGMGGWSLAASRLGFDSEGVEIWDRARETREAAGFRTAAHDVRDLKPSRRYDLLIASPPCQTFSPAGNGTGRRALDAVLDGVARFGSGQEPTFDELAGVLGDDRTALVLEPLRHALVGRPKFIAWEQVVTVRPVWEACAEVLRSAGYLVEVAVVKAEEFGVAQTRRRAVLMAQRLPGSRPTLRPSHAAHRAKGSSLPPPVSMAEALGWEDDGTLQRSNYSGPPTKTARTAAERGRTMRALSEPSVTITGKSFQWQAPDGTRRRSTVEEALRLQSFPVDFPVVGDGTEARLQVGNAVPPAMAEGILRAVVPSWLAPSVPVAELTA